MNKVNLLFIALAVLFSCKTKTDTSKTNYSSPDMNVELQRTHDPVTYYKTTRVDSVVNTLIKNDSLGVALGKSSDNAPYLITVRTKPGFAEIHEQMDDIAIIRSGHAVLKTG